jgi:beta-mannosidase
MQNVSRKYRFLLLALGCASACAQVQRQTLDTGWRFRAVASAEHPEALIERPATVPGVVQTDLQHAGVIPDPFFGDNEKRLQWIGLTDWEYVDDFDVSSAMLRRAHVELVFNGLDTFVDVSLNGQPLLSADNQFRIWRIDVKPRLHKGRNTLRILFHSPTNLMTPIVARLPYLIPGTGYEPLDRDKGIYPVSHYMRKAPYSYGWDWGPKFVTEGIWRPVCLEAWDNARVTEFHIQQDSVTADHAVLEARLDLAADDPGPAMLQLHILAPSGASLPVITTAVTLDRGNNHLLVPVRIEHPQRWYPNGYGRQSRYRIEAKVLRNGASIASTELKTGLRSIELQRTPDTWGTSFTFVVNGIPIFAKGANFIPLDSFAPNIDDARRRAVLTAARDVHMNMIRIWGGGFYESDSFYDLCDELGLMVWHDFMFGGAMVPGDNAFQENVRAEATEQVQRLSDHPSLVLWCGNNEAETAWFHWDDHLAFEKSITPEQRERVWQDYVVMFRDILKSTVAQYGNGVPYWPSSPGSDFDDVPPGKQDGDMHSWKVWSAGVPYTSYAQDHPRFLSEFGFQSMPDLRTVRAEAGEEDDLKSTALQNHERFIHGYDRMNQYLGENFRPPRDFASFVYLSQIMQAEAIKFGVETMRSRRPETMGTLYWQLDDCWPVASWSSIDYFGRWKALQYYAARFYAPLLVVASAKGQALNVHLVSDEQAPLSALLHIRLMHFDGTLIEERASQVQIAPLASNAIPPITLSNFDPKNSFAVLTLEQHGDVLASNTVYFVKPLALTLPEPKIATKIRRAAGGYLVELRSDVLARAVQLNFGDLDVKPDDNFFDLLPNQSKTVHVKSSATLTAIEADLHLRSIADATQ